MTICATNSDFLAKHCEIVKKEQLFFENLLILGAETLIRIYRITFNFGKQEIFYYFVKYQKILFFLAFFATFVSTIQLRTE